MTRRGRRAACAAAVCGGLLMTATACSSGSEPTIQTPPVSTSQAPSLTPTASPSPSVDPAAQPAVEAYLAFSAAAVAAQRDPATFSKSEKNAGALTSVAFDPIRINYILYIQQLANAKTAFRGTPSQPRVTVKSVDLAAKPYPKVVLTDCPTEEPTWRLYYLKTGKVAPQVKEKVPRPYLATVEVIKVHGRWGASTINVDTSQTCTPA